MSAQRFAENGNVCPFMHRHFEECYCNSLSSQDIEKVISICGGNYRLCHVYKAKGFSEAVMKTAKHAPKIF